MQLQLRQQYVGGVCRRMREMWMTVVASGLPSGAKAKLALKLDDAVFAGQSFILRLHKAAYSHHVLD